MSETPHVFLHREANASYDVDAPWPGVPLKGDPHTITANGYTSPDGKLLMGTWESSKGVWLVDYKDWEYCHVLEGYCVITPDGGAPIELKAGDVFIVNPGLKGTWEVIERMRKYFVFALGLGAAEAA